MQKATIAALLTLALPVTALCAVDHSKAMRNTSTSAVDAIKVEQIKESMKSGRGSMMMGSGGSSEAASVSGKVAETMNSGGYTYANIDKAGKKTWVAFPTEQVAVGEELSFSSCMEMTGFQSKSLNRKFDSIYFCGAPEKKAAKKAAKSEGLTGKKSPGSAGAAASSSDKIKVEKASGSDAYTVAEVFSKAAALNGKKVRVKGKVVKVSSGIMDRNWIHLQDGSGNAKKKTNDLVVTSKQSANEGDIVTITGTVAKDKDFGSGYKYNVIVEQATVSK